MVRKDSSTCLVSKHNDYPFNIIVFRNDIKSPGKFAIFRRLKIEGGGEIGKGGVHICKLANGSLTWEN